MPQASRDRRPDMSYSRSEKRSWLFHQLRLRIWNRLLAISTARAGHYPISPTMEPFRTIPGARRHSRISSSRDVSLASAPVADTSLLQPWVLLGLPLSGTVSVIGTSVTLASGSPFPLNLVSNITVILIGGIAFQVRGQPRDASHLELYFSAGVQTTSYLIASPELAGSPLPFAFGPLEGPFAPVIFALGDPINSGTLYWSNFSNLDAQAGSNTLELCGPSEPLVSRRDLQRPGHRRLAG